MGDAGGRGGRDQLVCSPSVCLTQRKRATATRRAWAATALTLCAPRARRRTMRADTYSGSLSHRLARSQFPMGTGGRCRDAQVRVGDSAAAAVCSEQVRGCVRARDSLASSSSLCSPFPGRACLCVRRCCNSSAHRAAVCACACAYRYARVSQSVCLGECLRSYFLVPCCESGGDSVCGGMMCIVCGRARVTVQMSA